MALSTTASTNGNLNHRQPHPATKSKTAATHAWRQNHWRPPSPVAISSFAGDKIIPAIPLPLFQLRFTNQRHPKRLQPQFPAIPIWPQPELAPPVSKYGGLAFHHSRRGTSRADFPADFVFGAASSAYQVEGAAFEDGRTASILDTFAHAGYLHGDGDIACDRYHKYKEDIQLMVDTGLEAFRFSISWSRLIPNGTGTINPKGLQYYNNFINELIKNGIQPHVTLHHSDLPQILEDRYGGFLSREIVNDFTEFADVCFREFGDRVSYWTTFNEANVFVIGGYDSGLSPPARCSSPFGIRNCSAGNSTSEPYIAAHNILLAHASTASLYQKKYKATQNGFIGINLFGFWFIPYSNSTEDAIAVQRALDYYSGWFVNPLVYGDYPEIMKKNAGTRIPAFTEEESLQLKGSFDFIGLNHYFSIKVMDQSSSLQMDIRDFTADVGANIIYEPGVSGQPPSDPSGLYALLDYYKNVYGNPPMYIHENGLFTPPSGELNDTPRIEYLHDFIGSVLDAIRNGSNTRGYFIWSFIDLYELLFGYDEAYGLYYVDREDKELPRIPKLSAHWYSNFLKGRNISLDEFLYQNKGEKFASS